jgi:hypothetical protein
MADGAFEVGSIPIFSNGNFEHQWAEEHLGLVPGVRDPILIQNIKTIILYLTRSRNASNYIAEPQIIPRAVSLLHNIFRQVCACTCGGYER